MSAQGTHHFLPIVLTPEWVEYHIGKEANKYTSQAASYHPESLASERMKMFKHLCGIAFPILKEITQVDSNKKDLLLHVNKDFQTLSASGNSKGELLELLFKKGCGISIFPHKTLDQFRFSWVSKDETFQLWLLSFNREWSRVEKWS